MLVDEDLDARQGVHKILCKLRERNLSDHDQQCHAVLDDGGKLVGGVADALVVGDADTAVAAAVLEPLFVGAVGREEVRVPFDAQAGGGENFREALSEIAVGEPDEAHAARS